MDAENKQYYAKWSAPKTYTVNWDLNDATPAGNPANNPNTVTGYTVLDPDFALAPATRAGYTFLGWFTDAGLTTAAPATLVSAQGDTNPTDLYAKWSAPLPYSITYVMNDTTPAGHTASNPASNPAASM